MMRKILINSGILLIGALLGAALTTIAAQRRMAAVSEGATERTKMALASLTLSLLADGRTEEAVRLNCTWAREGAVMVNLAEVVAGHRGSQLDRAAETSMDLVRRLEAAGQGKR